MLAVMEDTRVQASDAHAAWSESFNELFARVAGDFANAKVRRHGRAYLLGLLSHQERKNSWSLAELAGDVSPDGMQRLLNFSPWDQDACRDAVCRYVVRFPERLAFSLASAEARGDVARPVHDRAGVRSRPRGRIR